MQKINFRRILVMFLFIISISNISIATQEEILQSQSEALKIKDFVEEANKYTKDTFTGVDVNNLMNDAIKGNINNKTLIGKVINLFGKEIGETLKIVVSIIVVIVVHSILKSVSDGLENKSISQITYYVQYILIVTLVMSNFSDIIKLTKDTIQNLVGFSRFANTYINNLNDDNRKYNISRSCTTYITISY